jgi:hypothetical protein
MATATLMAPAAAYHPHAPSFPAPYSHQPPSMPGISQAEPPRRTSHDSESSQRQSLPSLSEVFSGSKPSTYSPTTPTTMAGSQSLPPPPPPFATSAPSRPEPAQESRPAPPHEDKFLRYQRSDVGPANGPPGPAYQYGEQRELTRPSEPPQRNGSFSNPHPHQAPYPQPSQLPPGQLPLSQGPPISPRHLGPPVPPYEPQRPTLHQDDEYGVQRRYDANTLNRHFEAWGYTDCLQRVSYTTSQLNTQVAHKQ